MPERRPPAHGPDFARIAQAPNLTGGLVETLVAQIELGQLAPGQRLPTEQAMVAATGVSRTVVREALASLRARGLITTRQGLGAFVADRTTPRAFTIDGADNTVADALRVLELRLGIEVEAAGLAAERRTPADLAGLRVRFEALATVTGEADAGAGAGAGAGIGAEEDFEFHRAILGATQNPYFTRVFDVFGSHIIPRQRVRLEAMQEADLALYRDRLRREHLAILQAIETADPAAARQAAHDHLARSRAWFIENGGRAGE